MKNNKNHNYYYYCTLVIKPPPPVNNKTSLKTLKIPNVAKFLYITTMKRVKVQDRIVTNCSKNSVKNKFRQDE